LCVPPDLPSEDCMSSNICQWTAERVAMLRRLWTTMTMTASEVAKEMGGVTRCAVIGKVHRLGIANDHHANAQDDPNPSKRKRRRKQKPTTPPAAMFVVPKIIDLPPETSPDGCTIMDLQPHNCRWPIDAEPSADMKYCGARIVAGPYCDHHARMAWKPGGRI
jgi:GcrA cell cycle regulator